MTEPPAPPRDDNLRLLGAAEERAYIARQLRKSVAFAVLGLFVAALSARFGLAAYASFDIDAPNPWHLTPGNAQWLLVAAGGLGAWAAATVAVQGLRVARYLAYRREHRDFLRRYNRL